MDLAHYGSKHLNNINDIRLLTRYGKIFLAEKDLIIEKEKDLKRVDEVANSDDGLACQLYIKGKKEKNENIQEPESVEKCFINKK